MKLEIALVDIHDYDWKVPEAFEMLRKYDFLILRFSENEMIDRLTMHCSTHKMNLLIPSEDGLQRMLKCEF